MRTKNWTLLAVVALAFHITGCSAPSPGQALAGTSPSAAPGTFSDPVLIVDLPRKPGSDPAPCPEGPEVAVKGVDEA
ncbi:hypothetical protein GCM10007175_21280 [Pseudarthrobacter scleromae]|uniref:Uncharacterized protein n=1 Tax=Pseudarthrobacter scleromae TaxID=158897 RepID=A0ABQ2CEK2_9MICC|nr:hypothetical protein GCM10007175_21280 [Pseudarthrobacter scleromae]